MKFFSILISLFLVFGFKSDNPIKVTWKTLSNVDFTKKWNKEANNFEYIANFSPEVAALNGKTISITGFMIPVDIESEFYVLSANPYASCFFCGNAGPETVMSIKFEKKQKHYNTDERINVQGKLRLNKDDINELTYILEKAIPLK